MSWKNPTSGDSKSIEQSSVKLPAVGNLDRSMGGTGEIIDGCDKVSFD